MRSAHIGGGVVASGRSSRSVAAVLASAGAAASLMAVAAPASAQWVWATGTGSWNTGTNWGPATVPTSGLTTVLTFNNSTLSTGYTSTNNVPSPVPFVLTQLNFSNEASSAISIGGTQIAFDGASSLINQQGAGAASVSANLLLNQALNVGGSGLGTVTLSGIISGGNGVNIGVNNRAIFSMSGSNTFIGNTSLNSGIYLMTGSNTQLGAAANQLNVNGGQLRFGTAMTIANQINFNQANTLVTGVNGASLGNLAGSGQVTFGQTTGSTTNLTGANSGFTGALVINSGVQSVNTVAVNGAAGSLSNVSAVGVFSNNTLSLGDLAQAPTSRINASAAINLHRGNLTLVGGTGGPTTHNLGAMTATGTAAVSFNNNTLQTTVANAASLSRGGLRGTWNITGNLLGAAAGANVSQFYYGGAPVPGTIIPEVFAAQTQTGGIGGLATYDTNGVRTLTLAEYNTTAYLSRNAPIGQAVRFGLPTASTPNTQAGFDTPLSAPGFVIDAGTLGGGAAVYGSGRLVPTTGAIAFVGGGTSTPLPSIVATGVDFGSAEGIAHVTNAATIAGVISGSNGFTKAGLASLTLTGANTFTGDATFNSGQTFVSADSAFGNAANRLVLAGGITGGLTFLPSPVFTDARATSLSTSRDVALGPAGGIVSSVGILSLNLNGTISDAGSAGVLGRGALFINSGLSGIVNLSGNNTYTGNTVLASGTLGISSDANLGVGGDLVLGGGILRANAGGLAISRNVQATATSTIYTANGNSITFSGSVGTPGLTTAAGLTQIGSGDLNLTAANPLDGPVTLGSTTIFSSAPSAQAGGLLSLSGAGSLARASSYTVNPGGTIRADNTSQVANRLSLGAMTLGGGGVALVGNASSDVREFAGSLTVAGSGAFTGLSTVTVTGGGATTATDLNFLTFSRTGTGSVLFRGDNLGVSARGTAGGTNIMFATAPTLTNSVLPYAVYDSSATGVGSSHASYSAANGVIAAAYTALNAAAPTSTQLVDYTAATTIPAASTVFGFRLGSGVGLTLGSTLTMAATNAGIISSGSATISGGTLALGSSAALVHTASGNLNISSVVTGSAGILKSGPGSLTLSTANPSLTGTSVISGGRLVLGVAGALPNSTSTSVTVSPGGVLDLNGLGQTVGAIAGYGTIDFNSPGSPGSLTVGSTSTFLGRITGNGSVTVGTSSASSNSLTLAGISDFTGGIAIQGSGTLTLASTSAVGTGTITLGSNTSTSTQTTLALGPNVSQVPNAVTLTGTATATAPTRINQAATGASQYAEFSGTFTLSRTLMLDGGFFNTALSTGSNYHLSGPITGAGGLYLFGGNYSVSNAANDFSGGLILDAGLGNIFGVGADTALGSGPITVTAFGGNFRADGGARTIANPISMTASTGASGAFGTVGVNDITFTGPVGLGAFTVAMPIVNTGLTTYSGVITGTNTTGATITKTGGGTLVFSNGNNYTGNTAVNAGTLRITNTSGSATGTGDVLVASGAILAGTGIMTGTANIAAGGILSPGVAGPGTLTIGALASVAGSIFSFDLNVANTVGGTNDLVVITGALPSIQGQLDIVQGGSFGVGTYTLFSYTGPTLSAHGLTLSASFLAQWPGSAIDITTNPQAVLLNVIPSPAALAMFGVAGVVSLRRRRAN
ncbi:MAG: autotransporter-associated beta strand repeat-containing protein [Phycisphaerales bacterium]|nr:autotransporter-associated beta strand repeat-containing protein [Phycisphaerales bacterium]